MWIVGLQGWIPPDDWDDDDDDDDVFGELWVASRGNEEMKERSEAA